MKAKEKTDTTVDLDFNNYGENSNLGFRAQTIPGSESTLSSSDAYGFAASFEAVINGLMSMEF